MGYAAYRPAVAVTPDLLVLAELNPDVLVAPGSADLRFGQVEQLVDRAMITLGSSGAITACAAAAQGLSVAVCAVVGDDPVGDLTTDLLRGQGVNVSAVVRRAGRQTGLSVVLTREDGDRAILTYSGTMAELSAADIAPSLLSGARHVHASSYFLQRGLQSDLPALFSQARAVGATTSLDTGWAPRGEWADVRPALDGVDYLLPNAGECVHLAAALDPAGGHRTNDESSVRRAAVALRRIGPTVVVKLGPDGALAAMRGGWVRARGHAVRPVDTTGAGDCFNAGFIAGILDGAGATDALRRAIACGGLAVTGWGGTGRLATRDEALQGAGLVQAVEHEDTPSPRDGEPEATRLPRST
jgi:ribokinase